MIKRHQSTLLSLIVLFAVTLGSIAYSTTPSDVIGCACSRDVEKLQYIGVIAGYPDGTFKPANPIRRSEIAKIVVVCKKIADRAQELMGPTQFPDVAADHWARGFINAAVETEIIKGYTDGEFKPDRDVTYAEALTMLVRPSAGPRPPAPGPITTCKSLGSSA